MINADDMQSWAYLLAPTFQFVNTAGKPLTEGYIEVYIAGTRNKYYCASDFNGTLHPFQIPLDSLGANIVLADPDQAYDVYVYNKYGSLVMSRYHVSPGMAGGSGVLSITIGSEDGTVSVTNDGNGNFDLSIQDTVDRIDALEEAVSGLSTDSTVGYAIAHAYTVELDGTFDLVNDAVTGIGYTPNMDGFRLKSGHVYQFNFNALFENGEFDRNCSGKLYLEGPNTIAQEWKFDLDDSYYHSQSINGSTVLVTPNDLNYYDVKLKLAWDVDYPNKPNVDLNKISIVDITTILSTTVSGIGGNYTGGDGIFVNDETYVISVDMDYINSHLNIDATEIIASAVNIATAYTDARVTSVSGDLVNLIAEVSASIPTGIEQVQSDWNEQDSSSPAYINNKPDLTIYATNASVSAVSSVLQSEIDAISGAIPTDYVTHNEVSAVSGNIIEYVNSVSGDLVETINNVSGDIIHTVESVSGDIIETVNNVSGDIIHTVETVSGDIIETITTVSGDIIETVNNVSGDIIHTVESVSGDLVEIIETATANIPEQVNADWEAVSGKAEILNKPDLSVYATHEEVSGVSAVLNERINNVSGDLIETITTVSGDIINTVETVSAVLEGDIVSAIQVATGAIPELPDEEEVEFEEIDLSDYALASAIPTDYVTHNEVSAVSANLVNYVNSVSGDITNYVDESIVSAINVATGACEQVQSDWTEDDSNDPAYIQNKPNEIELIAGQGIGIFSNDTTITIAASATDLSDYATHSEVNNVSGVLETEIQIVSAAIGEQVPNVSIQSTSGTLVVTETVSGNNKIYSIDVAPTSGIEYGQFYANNITGAATMARTKGNIDITNDGKIKLKQGQSYHVTVRGRYNQTVLKDNYSYASYIEYVTNNSININVDESRSGSQYFELSYDLFKLNSDTDYYVSFSLDDATVNDLFIDIHSLANVGSNSSSGGSSPEYDAGYGIQILNNVISVSGIAPQVQSDWNQTNTSSVDYIKNKPEEYGLLAGDNISITASGNNFVISSTASAATGIDYQAGYGIDITGDTISVDTSIIPSTSAYATHEEVYNATVTAIQSVTSITPVVTGYVTEAELQTVSGSLHTEIVNVSAAIPTGFNQVQSDWEQTIVSAVDYIKNKPEEAGLIAGDNISITASGNNFVVNATVPDVSNFVTGPTVSAIVDEALVDVPSGVSGVVAGDGISITASGSNYVISCNVTGGGDVTRADLDAVSGKLPTTELGKFTIQNNVTGGPIAVICPTDQGFPIETVILDNNQVSGSTGSGTTSVYIVYKSPGYDNDYYSEEGPAILHIPEAVTGLAQIQIVYAPNSNPVTYNGPAFTNPSYIYGDSTGGRYVLDAGDYDVNVIANQTPPNAGYGKYITLYASGPAPDVQALLKSSFSLAVRHPELGITVNLDRYALGNSSTITNTSGRTQADIYTDPTSKKQSVYLPNYMPSNWTPNSNIAQTFQYGNSYVSPSDSNYSTKLYKAYKYTSSPRRYQFAYLSDWDYANKLMTFIAYDDSGNAIEKWTVDYTTYGSAVWTTEAISSGSTYTAGDYIGITDDTISVTGITDLVAGDNITITASGSSAIISVSGSIQSQVSGASGIAVNDNVISLDNPVGLVAGTNVSIEVTGSSAIISAVGGGSGDVTIEELASVSGTLEAQVQTVSSAIPTLPTEEEIEFAEVDLSDYALASAIPDVSNFVTGPTVSAIVDTALVDVPTGVSGLVGGTNVSITASGSNYVIDATVPDVSNLATKTEVTTGLGTKQNTLTGITDVQVVQALPVSPVSTVLYLIPEV